MPFTETMDIDLREIEESNETKDRIEIFQVINDALRSPASSPNAKATSIVNGLKHLQDSKGTLIEKDNFRWEVWCMIVDLARHFPPGHPWQQVHLGVVSDLRNRAGHSDDAGLAKWGDLSNFTMYLIDHWVGTFYNISFRPGSV